MTYVKQNKWKFFTTLVLIGSLFFAFNTFHSATNESIEIRHRKLLSTIGRLIESEHYSPRVIDDKFSKEVFNVYMIFYIIFKCFNYKKINQKLYH